MGEASKHAGNVLDYLSVTIFLLPGINTTVKWIFLEYAQPDIVTVW